MLFFQNHTQMEIPQPCRAVFPIIWFPTLLFAYVYWIPGFCFPHQHNDAIKTNMFFRVLAVSFPCQPFVKIFIENGDNLRQTIAGQTKSCNCQQFN